MRGNTWVSAVPTPKPLTKRIYEFFAAKLPSQSPSRVATGLTNINFIVQPPSFPIEFVIDTCANDIRGEFYSVTSRDRSQGCWINPVKAAIS
jgi:hypothetical protein